MSNQSSVEHIFLGLGLKTSSHKLMIAESLWAIFGLILHDLPVPVGYSTQHK
jgi:hypothetical protein